MLPSRGSGCKVTKFNPYSTLYQSNYASLLRFFKTLFRQGGFHKQVQGYTILA